MRSRQFNFLIYSALVVSIYVVLVSFSVTTSHLGAVFGEKSERAPSFLSAPRPERSDEYLRGSPRLIASLQQVPLSHLTPLDVSGSEDYRSNSQSFLSRFLQYSRPPHLVLADELGRVLPIGNAFAVHWWLALFSLLVGLPIFFSLLGLKPLYGCLASIAAYFCTVNAWFSNLPVFLLSQAVVASVTGIVSVRLLLSNRFGAWRFFVSALLAFYAGRSAFTVLEYPPWGFPILAMFIVCSVVSMWSILKSKRNWFSVVLAGTVALVAVLLTYANNRNLYELILNTEYPGKRRTPGGNVDTEVWSGLLSWMMQGERARELGLTNPEMALGPTFLALSVGGGLCLSGWRHKGRIRPAAVGVMVVALLVVWSTIRWPKALQYLNPMVLIPAERASQIAGFIALVSLFLFFADHAEVRVKPKLSSALVVVFLVLVVTAADIEKMRSNYLQSADLNLTWLSVLLMLILTLWIAMRWRPMALVGLVALLSVTSSILVSPFTIGVGPLEDSQARTTMMDLSREDEGLRWATTGFFQDALMTSTGVPQLSGQQPLGPNSEAWKILDPTEKSKNAWNRGQSYVNFQWDGRPGITIWNPSPDVIQVVVDPCRPELDGLDLGWVVTADEISFYCLEKAASVTWMGAPLNIYRRTPTAIFGDVSN